MSIHARSGRATRAPIFAIAFTALLTAIAPSAFPQTSRGTVSGVVTDQTGAAVAGAKVELTNKETNVTRDTESNTAGLYRFDAVDLGTYDVNVRMSGFRNAIVRGFTVAAGNVSTVDVRLDVGETQTVVEVSGQAVALQVEAPVRGANVTTTQIAELPYSGRNPVALALNVPGVSTNRYGNGDTSFVVNGARGRSNNFLLDGTENNDISVAGQGFKIKNPDAVAEVSVQTAQYDAEFGRAGGGVVNVVTKSGTNEFHGSAGTLLDWTYDDAITNTQALAPDVQQRGRPLPGTDQWFFGTIGGPVVKNRTFFFGSYSHEIQFSQSQGNVTVPTDAGWATLNSLFPTGRSRNLDLFRSLVGPARGTSQLTSIPLGDGRPDVQFGTSIFPYTQRLTEKQYNIRIDHKLGENDLLYGRLAQSLQDQPVGGETTSFPGSFTSYTAKYINALISETHIFSPSLTNEVRLSYNRIALDYPMDPANQAALSAPGYTIQGLTVNGVYSVGIRSNFPQGRIANNYVLQDTATKIFGKHSVRFGFDLLKQRSRQFAPIPMRGQLTYNASNFNGQAYSGFANFIEDFGGAGGGANKTFGSAVYYPELFRQAYFVQDRWRVTQTVTLSLGLRWEDFGTPVNSIAKASWSGLFNVDPVTLAGPYSKPSGINRDLNNFAPMFGIAYAPEAQSGPLSWIFGQKKGVFRAGYGVGYESFFNNIASNAQTSTPNTIATLAPASVVGAGAVRGTANLSSVLPTTARAPLPSDAQTLVPGDLVNPYYQRWSAGIQREMPQNILLDISYVGSKGTKLFLNEQLNPTVPLAMQITPVPQSQIAPAALTGRYDALQGSRNIRTNGGDSNFHSLQTTVHRRFAKGFDMRLGYTWSKLIDNGGDVFAISQLNQTQNPSVPAFLGGLQRDRAVSMYDRTHRAVIQYIWQLPWMKNQRGFAGHVLGGWQLAGTTTFESGPPFNVTNGVDADGIDGAGDRPMYNPNGQRNTRAVFRTTSPTGYVNPDAGNAPIDPATAMFISLPAFSGTTPKATGNLGRNTLRAPGLANWDMNISKRIRISERMFVELRGEAYNIWNHPNYGTPSVSPFSPAQQGFRGDVDGSPAGRFLNWSIADAGGRVLRYNLKFQF